MGRRKRLHITSVVVNEPVEDHVEDNLEDSLEDHLEDYFEDQEAFETQQDQTTNEQGAPKRVRGYTQMSNTWKLSNDKRIVVTFNKFGKPVGEEGNELAQFLGTIVRNADHVSIEYSDWRKVPIKRKEDMYSLVKSKFTIHPKETIEIKKNGSCIAWGKNGERGKVH